MLTYVSFHSSISVLFLTWKEARIKSKIILIEFQGCNYISFLCMFGVFLWTENWMMFSSSSIEWKCQSISHISDYVKILISVIVSFSWIYYTLYPGGHGLIAFEKRQVSFQYRITYHPFLFLFSRIAITLHSVRDHTRTWTEFLCLLRSWTFVKH